MLGQGFRSFVSQLRFAAAAPSAAAVQVAFGAPAPAATGRAAGARVRPGPGPGPHDRIVLRSSDERDTVLRPKIGARNVSRDALLACPRPLPARARRPVIALLWVLAALVFLSAPAQAQERTDNLCAGGQFVTGDFDAGWFHNQTAGTRAQDGFAPTGGAAFYWALGQTGADMSVVQIPADGEGVGPGLTSTQSSTRYAYRNVNLTSANLDVDLAVAVAQGDYIQVAFSTPATVDDRLFFKRVGFGAWSNEQYRYTVRVSTDPNFASFYTIAQHYLVTANTGINSYLYVPADTIRYPRLAPSTKYYIRIYLYSRTRNVTGTGGFAVPTDAITADDFQFGTALCPYDRSDAPTSYGETEHGIDGTFYLGTLEDADIVSLASANALGDDTNGADDEDALTTVPPVPYSPGATYTLPNLSCPATALNSTVFGYLDFNRDGDFADSGERSTSSLCVGNVVSGISWTIPAAANLSSGASFMRLRLGVDLAEINIPSGRANRGEVEDYSVTIQAAATVTVTKISNGGVGTFAFTGTNGFAAQDITTVTAGTGVAGATQTLTTAGTATTITETAPPEGFALQSITCTGLGAGGTATPTINGTAGGSVALNAAATVAGSNIQCTFTNARLQADLSITKTNTPGVNGEVDQATDTVAAGGTTGYTLRVTNSGPTSITGAVVRDTPGAGITCPGGNAVTITGDGVPMGTFTIADLTGTGITLGTLTSGQTTVLSFSCNVQ